MDELLTWIASRTRATRLFKDWSQRKTGLASDILYTRLSDLENGKGRMYLDEAIRLARSWNMSLDEIYMPQCVRENITRNFNTK